MNRISLIALARAVVESRRDGTHPNVPTIDMLEAVLDALGDAEDAATAEREAHGDAEQALNARIAALEIYESAERALEELAAATDAYAAAVEYAAQLFGTPWDADTDRAATTATIKAKGALQAAELRARMACRARED